MWTLLLECAMFICVEYVVYVDAPTNNKNMAALYPTLYYNTCTQISP